jgi:hypothetical protein
MFRTTRPRPLAAALAAAFNLKESSMKFAPRIAIVFASACLAFSAPVLAGGAHDHTPKHGGIVVEANDLDFELVAKADLITVHVRDHGKVASTKGATGKLTILAGAEKTEVALAPVGEDRMEAKGSFKVAAGTRIVATINLAGKKPANVRFALK